ncbi:RNA-directed DNA polymerase, eukaryota, reverse transcriptase zinc-binding domain protein [Tanacetum coccineum]
MVTLIDFSKFAMNHLKLDKITKADLVGPVYKLLKGTCKSDRCPYDLSKPLPLQGSPGHLTIPVDFFFNNDLEYLKTGISERKYIVSITKTKTARYELKFIEEMIPRKWSLVKVAYNRDAELILSVTRVKVDKQYGYGYLEEIVVRRADRKEYTFKEGDFKRLHLNDIEDMLLLQVQNKLFNLLGDEIFNLFSNGTLKSVYEILYYRLLNFKLGYNKDMPKRKWTDKDRNRTDIMVKLIDKHLLEIRIMRNLECLVGGRKIKTDYRLLHRTCRDFSGGKQSRSQKKRHKAMLKLGMKDVLGVSRVTIKRTKNVSSCCILSCPKELQVPSGSVSLLQWVGSSVGYMIALSLRPRISSKNPISQVGLTGVADNVAVNDSATCAGFAPAILSNPVDVIKDRVMKGQLIVRLTQLRRKCRRCSTTRPETLIGLAFGAHAIFNCLENLAESNYGLLRNMF